MLIVFSQQLIVIYNMERRPLQAESDSALKVQSSELQLSQLEYNRPLGAYKPHFHGIPEDYFPSAWWEVMLCVMLILFIIGSMLGVMIGFLVLDFTWGTHNFVLLFSIIFVVFWILLLLAIYIGGRQKLLNERKLIQQSLRRMKQQQNH